MNMIRAYDAWWDDMLPEMRARGGEVELTSVRGKREAAEKKKAGK